MLPSFWCDGKRVNAKITMGGVLQYQCPFCEGACELDPWLYKVDGNDVRTVKPVRCCFEKCQGLFEIVRNCFIPWDGQTEIVKPYDESKIFKLWKGYNERTRKRPS